MRLAPVRSVNAQELLPLSHTLIHPLLFAFLLIILQLLGAALPASGAFTAYTLGTNYSKRESPGKFSGKKPMIVSLRMRIMDILKINDFDSELSLDLLVHRYWNEPRIEFLQEPQAGRQYPVDSLDLDKFWTPDLYVVGMREFHLITGSLGLDHIILRPNKSVEQLFRASLSLRCDFNFQMFPLDKQECKLEFMSPSQPQEEMVMEWWAGGRAVEFYHRSPPLQLSLAQYEARLVPCPRAYAVAHVAGNVSSLRMWLVLHRYALSHVLEIYLPTGLFVVISWGSFLVKPEMVPGRMVLLVTNLLSLVTIFEASRTTTPPATGLKCLDVWLVACIIFLFFALLEYAVILLQLRGRLCRQRASTRVRKVFVNSESAADAPSASSGNSTGTASVTSASNPKEEALSRQLLRKLRSRVRRFTWTRWLSSPRETSWCLLDQLSVFAFPVAFLIFNVAYWAIYLGTSASNLQSTTCVLSS